MATITTRAGKGSPLTNDEVDANFTNLNTDKAELSGANFTGAVDVDGNITTTGTVDGRDIASDGTKLDGIESGATADQTDAEIRAAVEAATDSNVFTDADHSKLDGIEASADVTDTANVTAAGALMDSELTSEASVKALNQGVATTDSPTFAGIDVTGTIVGDGLDVTVGTNDRTLLQEFNSSNNLSSVNADNSAFRPFSISALGTNIQYGGTDTLTTGNNLINLTLNSGSISHGFSYNENGGEIALYDETGTAATLLDQANNNTRLLELIDGSNIQVGLGGSNTTGSLIFTKASGVEFGRITGSGFMGLNNPDPDTTLHIGNISATNATHQGRIKLEDLNSSLNTSGGLEFVTSSFGSGYGWKINSVDSTGVHLDFGTRQNSTTWSNSVRFIGDGRVAIGDTTTNNITNRLKVKGTQGDDRIAMSTASTTGNATIEAQVANYWTGPTYTGTGIVQHDSASSGTTAGISNANLGMLRFQNGSAGLILTNGATPIHFATAVTNRMTLDASGNLGIGESSPTHKLDIEAGSLGTTAGNTVNIFNSSFLSSNLDNLEFTAQRISSGSDWQTAAHRIQRKVDTTLMGYMQFGNNTTDLITFGETNTEYARIDGSGNLLVGTTSTIPYTFSSGTGAGITSTGTIMAGATAEAGLFNRIGSDGSIVNFYKAGGLVGSIGVLSGRFYIGNGDTGIKFSSADDLISPIDASDGTGRDAAIDLGSSGARFNDIYAVNGTIQTSDRTEKQDIEALSDAEQRVAIAAKGLLRKFRWIDAVEAKGDDARIHFGIIAQDLQDAFTAEGLDAGRYGMFINSTWTDEETGEERSRMGVRYSELLAFIISAI